MPIIYRNEPPEAAETVKAGLELMASKRAFNTPRLRSVITEKGGVPLPERALPVYHLGLSDIAKDPDIKASIQTGWRFTLKLNNEILAHAEVITDPKGKQMFASINEGPIVEGAAKAIKVAEDHSEIKEGNFEVRLLFIPALNVVALWLADEKGKADFSVPFEQVPAPLIPNMLIPLKDLLMVLNDKARSVLEYYYNKKSRGG